MPTPPRPGPSGPADPSHPASPPAPAPSRNRCGPTSPTGRRPECERPAPAAGFGRRQFERARKALAVHLLCSESSKISCHLLCTNDCDREAVSAPQTAPAPVLHGFPHRILVWPTWRTWRPRTASGRRRMLARPRWPAWSRRRKGRVVVGIGVGRAFELGELDPHEGEARASYGRVAPIAEAHGPPHPPFGHLLPGGPGGVKGTIAASAELAWRCGGDPRSTSPRALGRGMG
jgi:hypothetical protein